jgi:hypothetical protein
MEEQKEVDRLWNHLHALRGATDATGITVAVIQERQKSQSESLDRIEAALRRASDLADLQAARLLVLETKAAAAAESAAAAAHSARATGAKWGAFVSALIAALIELVHAIGRYGK